MPPTEVNFSAVSPALHDWRSESCFLTGIDPLNDYFTSASRTHNLLENLDLAQIDQLKMRTTYPFYTSEYKTSWTFLELNSALV